MATMTPDLPTPLARAADDAWAAFSRAATEAGLSAPNDPETVKAKTLRRVFALSDFVAHAAARHPRMVIDLIDSGDFFRDYNDGEYPDRVTAALAGVTDETALAAALRELRRREMVRIAVRDLGGLSDLFGTVAHLSAFADAAIDGALSVLYGWESARSGVPRSADGAAQEMVVLAMGKLGAGELNFSSDVDLIFAFPERGETDGDRPVTCDEFFLRLGRKLIKALGANTADGFVFRVDMDLRPFGGNGPLVMSFDALESYYQIEGREWERYAWIKARPAAGDRAAGADLIARLNPFVYRRYLDYGVFESIRDMKRRIDREVTRREMRDHIKLGPGGIREIEFFGQIFQLIRGGVSRPLQERRLLTVLSRLVADGTVSTAAGDELRDAYIFLRNTEHRLQEAGDAQTHQLPKDEFGRLRLATAMGADSWEAFAERLDGHRTHVRRHFNGLLAEGDEPGTDGGSLARLWPDPPPDDEAKRILAEAGFEDPGAVLDQLETLREAPATGAMSTEGRDRLDRLVPRLLVEVAGCREPTLALTRIVELLRSIQRRTSYFSLLLENPSALSHLVRFAATSAWILAYLARHPVLLDELLDPRTLYAPPDREALAAELSARLGAIDPDDLEYQMETLRVFKGINVLRVAAADVTDALPLMRVSDHLSDLAEVIVDQVLDLCRGHLTARHGEPECTLPGCDRGFVVVAYGKLGGLELGYDSDLDLVFLHAGSVNPTQNGPRPTESSHFFSRLGQRVIHLLSSRTAAGVLYEADMRLRPSGRAGMLVSHIDSFLDYQINDAWTWEQQALLRARPICGDNALAAQFQDIRREILGQRRDPATLRGEVAEMRARLRAEQLKGVGDWFDLKGGLGGMVDVEFLVQYLVLRHAHRHPELLTWTDNVRQIATLSAAGIIDDRTAYFLRKAYLVYRTTGHRLSLQNLPARVPVSGGFEPLRKVVSRIWDRVMGESGRETKA